MCMCMTTNMCICVTAYERMCACMHQFEHDFVYTRIYVCVRLYMQYNYEQNNPCKYSQGIDAWSICIYNYIYACPYIHLQLDTFICMHVHMYVVWALRQNVDALAYLHARTCTYIHAYTRTHAYIHACSDLPVPAGVQAATASLVGRYTISTRETFVIVTSSPSVYLCRSFVYEYMTARACMHAYTQINLYICIRVHGYVYNYNSVLTEQI